MANANVRGPHILYEGFSSSFSPSNNSSIQELEVQREELTFYCYEKTSCEVRARYQVKSLKSTEVALEFIAPEQGERKNKIEFLSNGKKMELGYAVLEKTSLSEILPPGTKEADRLYRQYPYYSSGGYSDRSELSHYAGEPRHLYKARFTAKLNRGLNTIDIQYTQPLSSWEVGHGYFSKGELVAFIQYELWPLHEWKRAEDFVIDFKILVKRDVIDLKILFEREWPMWKVKNVGTPIDIQCSQVNGRKRSIDGVWSRPEVFGTSVQINDKILELRHTFDNNFQDRIFCKMGDKDILTVPNIGF